MKAPPIRLWIAVMIFFVTFTNYLLRANMPVSILAMAEPKKTNATPHCLEGKNTTTYEEKIEPPVLDPKYDWNDKQTGQIISGYFYGYTITSLPGGLISEIFGPWHVIIWSTLISALFTGLTPLFAPLGFEAVVVNRVIIGMLGGVAYPAINVLIAKWAPPKEKGKFMAALMGNTLGSVVSFNLVGVTTFYWGWHWGFYSLVIFLCIFCVVFGVIVRDTPEQHPWISKDELKYIKQCQDGQISGKKKIAPYKEILRSIPFWMTTIAQFGNLWGLNLVLTYTPKYMSQTLGFEIKKAAGLAALPYLSRLIFSQVFGILGDWMRKKEIMSLEKIRKFFIIFSHLIPAACMYLIIAAKCNYVVVIALLVLNQGFNGAVVVSHLVTPQDLAPNFAGTVYGMMNFIAMTSGFIVPSITGHLDDKYERKLIASQIIYSLGATAFALSGIIFILFGSASVQPWNEIEEKGKDDEAAKGEKGKVEVTKV